MLSQRIRNLRNALAATYLDAESTPDALALIVVLFELESFEAEAEAMENSRISPVAMAGCVLPDNAIRIAEKLHKQGVRLGMPDGVA